MKKSPFAPQNFPSMPEIKGVSLATAMCGIKYKDRDDLFLALLAKDTAVAGVFTQSKTASANIVWGREILQSKKARILIVNSGNANAFNGKNGEDSVNRIVDQCANIFNCKKTEIYPSATGVIGEVLNDILITDKLSELKENLNANCWEEAASAIMTTDTYPKAASRKCKIGDAEVTINGIAKGSGMIAPNMATMLAYIFTDAKIASSILQKIFSKSVDKSFNSITVDSDTSTSDTALIFATGGAMQKEMSEIKELEDFVRALDEVNLDLAHQIVKDGEGASKFITVNVVGAKSDNSAKIVAMSIANSPLFKTAIAGEDANWGRIIMAAGKSGQEMQREKIKVEIGGVNIVTGGQLNPNYVEDNVTTHMRGQEIDVYIDLGVGTGSSKVWTCDFTHDYISINADYRS